MSHDELERALAGRAAPQADEALRRRVLSAVDDHALAQALRDRPGPQADTALRQRVLAAVSRETTPRAAPRRLGRQLVAAAGLLILLGNLSISAAWNSSWPTRVVRSRPDARGRLERLLPDASADEIQRHLRRLRHRPLTPGAPAELLARVGRPS